MPFFADPGFGAVVALVGLRDATSATSECWLTKWPKVDDCDSSRPGWRFGFIRKCGRASISSALCWQKLTWLSGPGLG